MENNANINSYVLGLENLNRCKYGVSIVIYRTLKNFPDNFCANLNFKEIEYYLLDLEQYNKYSNEMDYASDFLTKYFNINCVAIPNDVNILKKLNLLSKKYSRYIITPGEVATFKEVYSYVVSTIIGCLKEKLKKPLLELELSGIYQLYNYETIEECNKHFFESVRAFFYYHKCSFDKIEVDFEKADTAKLRFYL